MVGVDGGGTRTRAVIVDTTGRVMGRGEYAGAVASVTDPTTAAEAVCGAVRRAAEEAGVALPAAALWGGLAGAGSQAARTAVAEALSERGLADRVVLGTDVEAAFHHAFGSGPGVLVISGTGSIVWARSELGEVHRVGGWGRHLGDEGSGFALGMQALRRAVRSEDGREPPTALRTGVLDALGLPSVEDLVAWIDRASKADVAALAPLVVGAADRDDAVAAAVVDEAVEELCAQVLAALAELADGSGAARTPEVVLWGGLIAKGGPLRERVERALARSGVEVCERDLDPPMGAAMLALAVRSD